jgi:hypothetical protein
VCVSDCDQVKQTKKQIPSTPKIIRQKGSRKKEIRKK